MAIQEDVKRLIAEINLGWFVNILILIYLLQSGVGLVPAIGIGATIMLMHTSIWNDIEGGFEKFKNQILSI